MKRRLLQLGGWSIGLSGLVYSCSAIGVNAFLVSSIWGLLFAFGLTVVVKELADGIDNSYADQEKLDSNLHGRGRSVLAIGLLSAFLFAPALASLLFLNLLESVALAASILCFFSAGVVGFSRLAVGDLSSGRSREARRNSSG